MMSKKKLAAIKATIATLVEKFPKCFFYQNRIPLKIGIHTDILDRMGDAISPKDLGLALSYYCGSEFYVTNAAVHDVYRVDLDGNRAGQVTESERLHYQKCKEVIKARQKAKWKAQKANGGVGVAEGGGEVAAPGQVNGNGAGTSGAANVNKDNVAPVTTATVAKPKLGLSALRQAGQLRRQKELETVPA